MKISEAVINGKKIRYSDHGEGVAIIMLHGFIERIEIWESMSDELSKTHRVVCIELPGHGQSELIGEVQTMESMATHIKQLINQLAIDKFVMIGHSMGGYITLAYAEMFPNDLLGVGLFHSHALADSDEVKIGRERTVDIIQKDRDGFIFNFIPELFSDKNREFCNDQIIWLQKGAKNMSKESLIACLRGMALRTDKLDFLTSTNIPIMFIIGKDDSRSPYHSVLAQAALPYHSEILLLGDCGHMGYIEKADETTRFVQSFVSNLSY